MRFIEQTEDDLHIEGKPLEPVRPAALHAALRTWPYPGEEAHGRSLAPSAEKAQFAQRVSRQGITMQRAALHDALRRIQSL